MHERKPEPNSSRDGKQNSWQRRRRRHETSVAHWAAEAMAITGDKALLLLGQEDAAAATVAVGAPNIATWEEGRAAAAAMRDMDAAFNLSAML